MRIRPASELDLEAIVQMCCVLWSDAPADEHRAHALGILRGEADSTLPLTLLVAVEGERVVGFVEVGLRSHAEDCDPTVACGFIEGWFVSEPQRRRGVGRALIDAAEDWARSQGCVDLASDTWLHDTHSQAAHLAVGFELAEKIVVFAKPIRDPQPQRAKDTPRPRTGTGRQLRSRLRAARKRARA